jgi:signal transduction histidine kinase
MAIRSVSPSRSGLPGSRDGRLFELLARLSDAAQSRGEAQVLAAYVHERYALPCVVLVRAPRGWSIAGANGLPLTLEAGAVVGSAAAPGAAMIDAERWVREHTAGPWRRRDLSHGRRVVARLMVQSDRFPDELALECAVAAPVIAAAFPRHLQIGGSPLELYLAQIVHDLRQPLSTLRLGLEVLRDPADGAAAADPVAAPKDPADGAAVADAVAAPKGPADGAGTGPSSPKASDGRVAGGLEPSEGSKTIDRCQRAVHDLSELVDDLLSFAAPKPRGLQPVRLRELAAQVVSDQEAHARLREVELRLDGRADPIVLGTPLALRRALTNVVDNAILHSPPGGQVEVCVDIDLQSSLLLVHDQGPGVPPLLREQVFEPFFTTRPGGSGLGLAVVRRVAQAHGGTAGFIDSDHGALLRLAIPHHPFSTVTGA